MTEMYGLVPLPAVWDGLMKLKDIPSPTGDEGIALKDFTIFSEKVTV